MTISRKIGRGMTNLFQENFEMITGSMQVAEIAISTTIEYYQKDLDESDQGYQRPLNQRRIQSMANSFERDIKNGSFLPIPTAIILFTMYSAMCLYATVLGCLSDSLIQY